MYHIWAVLMAIGFGVPLAGVLRLSSLECGLLCGAFSLLFTYMIHGL